MKIKIIYSSFKIFTKKSKMKFITAESIEVDGFNSHIIKYLSLLMLEMIKPMVYCGIYPIEANKYPLNEKVNYIA